MSASLPFAVEEGLEEKYSCLDTLEPDEAPQLRLHAPAGGAAGGLLSSEREPALRGGGGAGEVLLP